MTNTTLEIKAGQTKQLRVLYKDPAGAAIDLTGYTATLRVRRNYTAGTADVSLTEVSGIVITAASGQLDITIPAGTTSGLSGTYVWDLFVTSSGGIAYWLAGGDCIANQAA